MKSVGAAKVMSSSGTDQVKRRCLTLSIALLCVLPGCAFGFRITRMSRIGRARLLALGDALGMKAHRSGPEGRRSSSGCAFGTAEQASEKGHLLSMVRRKTSLSG
jgi:hypothetical protein